MKKLLIMITAVALLSGCGVFNKVFKHRTSEKVKEESSKEEKSKTSTSTTDRSTITITERLDSTVTTPEVKGTSKKKIDLETVKEGLTIIDDEFINLSQIYDPLDSTLKTSYNLKPRKVPVPKERKTEIQKNVNAHQVQEDERKEKGKKAASKSEAIVERIPDYSVFLIALVIISLLFFVGWAIKSNK